MVFFIICIVFGLPLLFVKSKYKILDSFGVSILIYLFLFIVGVPLIDLLEGINKSIADALVMFLISGMYYLFFAIFIWLIIRVSLEWRDKRKSNSD